MSTTIARHLRLLTGVAAALALTSSLALADNPHFVTANIAVNSVGNLVCSWKEAGLGTNQNIDYECTAGFVAAFYQCVNKGGGEPRPHTATDTSVTSKGTFNSGRNGQITASLTAALPTPPSDFCPNSRNWTLKLVGARWCDTSLEDVTNHIVGATEPQLDFGNTSSLPACP
jgi:hypothetical protein